MSDPIDGVAIIGISGRFPGAASVDALWENLINGIESITRFSPQQLSPLVAIEQKSHPSYVAARGVLADADRFDAAFFGIPAREALVMDPQQRLFLELAWNALEHGGYDPQRYAGTIGVYAGCSNNGYHRLVQTRPDLIRQAGEFATMVANEKDYIATRVAHRLNLTGPAISVHTACSTSLVAIAQAWYALMSYQCDMALAGGINVVVPQESGYVPVDGGMESSDGHCRPFDAAASGTLFSSGAGVVLLKRLADALADGDTVYAVIRGVGLNNDGGDKASFTAPSARGQAAVIRMALAQAGVDAASIGYVEGHGTATQLGDPIEVEALSRAYREQTNARQYCLLGSVKSNFGHLIAASGVTGLIKAALALHREQIPGTLHYRQPNPEIDFANSPFRVVAELTPWKRSDVPRRAAVSSFGVGGTNAHAVLEEAPLRSASSAGRNFSVLCVSARDEVSFARRCNELSASLANYVDADLADIAWTLAQGRRAMAYRASIAIADIAQARERLPGLRGNKVERPPGLVFLFPGQGSQHANMARELYVDEPVFRAAFDQCCALASAQLGRDLAALILPAPDAQAHAQTELAHTRYTQPALFVVEYALAQLLLDWGLSPSQMFGHSIGEYVAACLAGVFDLPDAVSAVVARAAAMDAQPAGAMLAVRMSETTLRLQLPGNVEIAAVNAGELCVVSGAVEAIDAFAQKLETAGQASTRLKVSHAFHSASMDGALAPFAAALAKIALKSPQRAFISCVTGLPITVEQATSIDYWCRQLRAPVRFADGIEYLATCGDAVLLEVGPSQALTALVRMRDGSQLRPIATQNPAAKRGDSRQAMAQALGNCWSAGIAIDWDRYFAGQIRQRIALPGYPFQGERYWITAPAAVDSAPIANPGELPMSVPVVASAVASIPRPVRIAAKLRELFESLSGESLNIADEQTPFLNLGLDSLSLTQASLEIERRFGLRLKFRRLMEDLDTIEHLAAHLDSTLPADALPEPVVAAPMSPVPATASLPMTAGNTPLQQLIQQQMALMHEQLRALSAAGGEALPTLAPALTTRTDAPPIAVEAPLRNMGDKPFGASARITTKTSLHLSEKQTQWLRDFTARYNARTAKSKEFSQRYRAVMADPRVVTGFNPLWKELVYPIVVGRSKGARLWDLDGNEYIDMLNGFGSNFLGYQPDFLVDAISEQMRTGVEVGPQHPLAGEVAELIAEFTGMQRVAFCNTGSEAVMGAMRIARTVTGRKTIVIFSNSYHGIFDEVLVRGTRQLRSIAAAPGILASAVENVLVLDYGSDESLKVIRERAHDLAAVMIEPVQSRTPLLQPREFVHELRAICDAGGCALIFDEVITGFRISPGGAQEFYGVPADIATYGKIIGGGLPFAAIAGKSVWMDALDGGHWQYGDDSYPEAGVTYFAGTFVRHPMALAAARAALLYLKQRGPDLQRDLNRRTAQMVAELNAFFVECRAPMKAASFSSLYRISIAEDQPYASLFYYGLRERGLHVWEQFGCFLTEAHGASEVRQIVDGVKSVVDELLGVGLLGAVTAAIAIPAPQAPPIAAVSVDSTPLPKKVPLTEAQLEKWLACQFGDEANLCFNESFALELSGNLNIEAFEKALQTIVERHEALHLRFARDGTWQEICADRTLHMGRVDLSDGAIENAEQRIAQFCAGQMGRPFALDDEPLVRMHLLRIDDQRHVFNLVAHHLVFDGWSASVFLDELVAVYNALTAGREPKLAAAESFRRYALEERERRGRPDAAAQLNYWKRQFLHLPDPLDLPTDRVRPQTPRYRGATLRYDLPAPLYQRLKQRAAQSGVTLYSLMLSAFATLVQRLSGQGDLVIGIPFAGQTLSRSKSLIGDGVNTLPLRIDVESAQSFADLLRRVHGNLLDAAENQDTTLLTIQQALSLPRRGDRLPLVELIFNLNPRLPALNFDGLRSSLRDNPKIASFWDLFFNFNDSGRTLALDLHYSSDLFEASTLTRWIGHFESLLDAIANAPSRKVDELPLFDETQKQHILLAGNATAFDFDRRKSLHALLAEQTARNPERIAAQCQNRTLTYSQLEQRATKVAHLLLERGVRRADLVGIALPRSLEMLVAVLGVLKAGAAYVPLDPQFPIERLSFMADHARIRVVLTLMPESVPTEIAAGRELIALAELDSTAVTQGSSLPTVGGEDLAYVLYTSGSTGQPKGVRILHRNLVNFVLSMQREPGLVADDVLCAATTLSFDIAGLELYLPLSVGAKIVIASDAQQHDPLALCDLICASGCTVFQTTPSLLRLLIDAGRIDALRGLKLLIGGEALPRAVANAVLPLCRELWNMYGPTETTIWSAVARVEVGDKAVSLGHPIGNTRIYVLDSKLQPMPEGVSGEIHIAGDGVADGYLHRPDLTMERFVVDPHDPAGARMYRTGDRGSLRDGALYFHGRIDQQIKIRGFRIEPGDIEAAACSDPAVNEAVVVVLEFGSNDQRLALYVASESDDPNLGNRLRQTLHAKLPHYMQPQFILRLDQLPRTPNGKLDRRALPRPAELAPTAIAPVPPSQGSESYLAALWKDLTGATEISAHDNFFDIGGHSVLAVEMVVRVQNDTGVRLNLLRIATATLRQLAAELPQAPSAPTPAESANQIDSGIGSRIKRGLRRLVGAQ